MTRRRPPGPCVEPSQASMARLELLFSGGDREQAKAMLVEDCGNNLPFCAESSAQELERIHIAALKVSGGTLEGLIEACVLAQTDWRDLLVAAGFADDVKAHEKWWPDRR